MNARVELTLPWPPSINTYWRHVGPRVLISAKGRAYRKAVADTVLLAGSPKMEPGRLTMIVTVFSPDRRARDLDNLGKALLDALERSGVYENDSLIDLLVIQRVHEPSPELAGTVLVQIEPFVHLLDLRRAGP